MKDEALGEHVSMKGVLSVMTLEAPTARTVPDHSEARLDLMITRELETFSWLVDPLGDMKYWWLTYECSHRCIFMFPLKITHSNVYPRYDLIISSIITYDQFSRPENGLRRKSLANRCLWMLPDVVGPHPCQMSNPECNSDSTNSTYSKGKHYLCTVENLLKLKIPRKQLILSDRSKVLSD